MATASHQSAGVFGQRVPCGLPGGGACELLHIWCPVCGQAWLEISFAWGWSCLETLFVSGLRQHFDVAPGASMASVLSPTCGGGEVRPGSHGRGKNRRQAAASFTVFTLGRSPELFASTTQLCAWTSPVTWG